MSDRKPLFLMTQEQAAALALLVEAAEAGDGAAACRLGDMYREALGGVRYSPGKAFRWYARSAMAGDEDGQNNLGACYEHGIGCAQSYPNAVKWYRRSVAQGVSTAYMNLGYCYLRGHGVPADKAEALKLFREAVARGEERAVQEVERLEEALSLRGLKLAPSDTAQVRPCSLASGVVPPDGPRKQLQPSQTAPAEVVTIQRHASTHAFDEASDSAPTSAGHASDEPEQSGVQVIRGITFTDETQNGKCVGLIGGVPTPPWEDEDVRRELMEVLSAETASSADGAEGHSEEELFSVFAECGMKPDDFVQETATRYAEYLKTRVSE